MVSSPPVEVLWDEEHDKAYVSFTSVGNSHVDEREGRLFLDEWALRRLASQAEQTVGRM